MRTGVRHAQPQHHAGVRRVLFDFFQLGQIVVGDQRFVFVERQQGFLRLGRIGVNDFVPDEILLLFGRQVLDVFIDQS